MNWSQRVCDLSLFDDSPSFKRSKYESCGYVGEANIDHVVFILCFVCSMSEIIGIFESFDFAWFSHIYKQSITIYNYEDSINLFQHCFIKLSIYIICLIWKKSNNTKTTLIRLLISSIMKISILQENNPNLNSMKTLKWLLKSNKNTINLWIKWKTLEWQAIKMKALTASQICLEVYLKILLPKQEWKEYIYFYLRIQAKLVKDLKKCSKI